MNSFSGSNGAPRWLPAVHYALPLMPVAEHIGESAPIQRIMKMSQRCLVPGNASVLCRELQQGSRIRVIECEMDSLTGATLFAIERCADGTTRISHSRGLGRSQEDCDANQPPRMKTDKLAELNVVPGTTSVLWFISFVANPTSSATRESTRPDDPSLHPIGTLSAQQHWEWPSCRHRCAKP